MRDVNEMRFELYNQFLNELPVLRARIGYSQEVLATKVGCSRQTINAIENRKKGMTWQLFMAMLAVFYMEETTRKMLDDMPGFGEKLNSFLKE